MMNTKFNYAGFIDMFLKPEEQASLVVASDRACPTVTPCRDMAQAVRPRSRQSDKTKS
jgi:hypothetical protein